MSEKWDVRDIAKAHFRTYVDAKTQKRRLADFAAFILFPLAAGALTSTLRHYGHFGLYDVSKFIGGVGIFTGLLFGLLTNVFTLSLRLQRDDRLGDEEATKYIKELFNNVSWAVVVGLFLIVSLVTCSTVSDPKKPVHWAWTGLLVATFLHLALTVLMSLKRLWLAHSKIPLLPPKVK
ncbi:hypothetical protein [Streptomyces sp. Ag109_O5-10]|uniref:hypothetical protein n=1 Tax=Streptomyces sp. Ag109_O5-10 TaxID=1855349 RepID=UPI000894FE37|nr:hypothetical protein [Streptomyces sp. Ag109_O5-10]SEE74677.1 hypothetical protein SAMN05216533_3517 [Streptomyces sp. Ag109_O5-10]